MSDDEALDLINQFDAAPEEDRPAIMNRLTAYEETKKQRAADSHFERLYADPAYFEKVSKSEMVATAASVSPFPDQVRYRGANRAFMAHQLGVPLEELNGTYEFQRDGYAKAHFGIEGEVAEDRFFNLIKGEFETNRKRQTAVEEIPADIVLAKFEDVATGKRRTSAQLLSEWKARNAELIPDDSRDADLLAAAKTYFDEFDGWMSTYAQPAREVYTYLAGFTGKEGEKVDEETVRKIGAALVDMPHEDRMKVYGMAALYAERQGADKGYFEQLGESISRTVSELGSGIRSANREQYFLDLIRRTEADQSLPEGERNERMETIQREVEKIQVARELFQVARGQIDPITPIKDGFIGMLEQGTYAAAGSVPIMAAAALPVVGAPLAMAAYTAQEYDRIRLEYPEVEPGQALGMAAVSGAVQGALDRLQVRTIAGALPATGELFEQLAKPTSRFFAGFVGRSAAGSGLNLAEQYGQETLQNLTPVMVEEVGRTLGVDLPGRDWEKEFADFKDSQVQTFFALLPFWLLGTGAISIKEWKRGQAFLADAATLEKAGIQAEAAADIASTEDLDKKQEKFQTAWMEMPAEKKRELIREMDAAAIDAQEQQDNPQMPTLESAKLDDGSTEWTIRDAEGREVFRTTNEDAATIAFFESARMAQQEQLLVQREAEASDEGQLERGKATAEDSLFGLTETIAVDTGVQDEEGAPGVRMHAREGTEREGDSSAIESAKEEGRAAAAGFQALGASIVSGRKKTRVVARPNGDIVLEVNERNIFDRESAVSRGGVEAGLSTRAILGEELIHVAHIAALKKEWQTSGQGIAFDKFVASRDKALFDDIRGTIDSAPESERKALQEAVQSVYNLYFAPLSGQASKTVSNLDTALAEIESSGQSIRFAEEFIRQAVQLRRQGAITENVEANILKRIGAWVRQAIDKIREVLPGVFKGEFGQQAKALVERIEVELDAIDGKPPAKLGNIESEQALESGGIEAKPMDPELRRQLIEDSLERLNKNPDERLVVYERAKMKLLSLMDKNRAVIDAMQWSRGASERELAQAGIERATGPEVRRQKFLQALGELDAILSVLPAEVRGKVGGYVTLANIGTGEAALTDFFVKRIEMIDKELERVLAKDYRERIDKLLDMAKPKGKPGERPTGKIGPEEHKIVEQINELIPISAEDVEAKLDKILAALKSTDSTDAKALSALAEELDIVTLFGDLDEKPSSALSAALDWLEKLYRSGRENRLAVEQAHAQSIAADQAALIQDTGKEGDYVEEQEQRQKVKSLATRLGVKIQAILNFEQTLEVAIGKGSTTIGKIVRRVRDAMRQKRDLFLKRQAEWREMQKRVFADLSERERRNRMWEMSQIQKDAPVFFMKGRREKSVTVTVDKARGIVDGSLAPETFELSASQVPELKRLLDENDAKPANRQRKNLVLESVTNPGMKTPLPMSQAQGINLTLLWRQERYQKAMSANGWTRDAIGSVERFLASEAKQIRDWLASKVDGEHGELNAIFERMFGMSLPKEPNYWPGTFEHDGETRELDPYQQGLMPEGGIFAGFTFTRKQHRAKPKLADAFAVYHSHASQIEHWKAFAELARDLKSIFGSARVKSAITAKAGSEYAEAIDGWISAFEQNGLRQRRFIRGLDHFFQRLQGSQAALALSYNVSSYFKQSMAAFGAIADMPGGEALKRYLSGSWTKHYQRVLGDPIIQRRMESGYSPEVRQAMESYRAEPPSRLLDFAETGLDWMGRIDAYFTAVSASVSYGYHFDQAKAAGLTDSQADRAAIQKAEDTVGRTAQPVEIMDRSLYELGMSPSARFIFMFVSPVRQQAAIEAMAIREFAKAEGLKGKAEAAKTLSKILFLMHVVYPVVGQTITNAWRDARDDDDDELFDPDNWRPRDYLTAMLMGPAAGLPVLGDVFELSSSYMFGQRSFKGGIDSDVAAGGKELKEIIFGDKKGERPWDKDEPWEETVSATRKIMTAVSLALGGRWAALGLGAKFVEQASQVAENVTSEDE